jgi:general stress protein 26
MDLVEAPRFSWRTKERHMDSINKEQTEHHVENLAGAPAIEKLAELAKEASTCFFCTTEDSGKSGGVRPMSVQQVDEQGKLWFLSASDSHQNREIAADPSVKLYFQGSAHAQFLSLEGTATISRDQAKIKELWKAAFKTWFTEGENDPRITLLEVAPSRAYYWDNKHGNMVAGIKMLIGAAIGKTMDDSIEGKLSV